MTNRTIGVAALVVAFILILIPVVSKAQDNIRAYGLQTNHQLSITDAFRREAKAAIGFEFYADLYGLSPTPLRSVCGEEPYCIEAYENGDCSIFMPFGLDPDIEQSVYIELLTRCKNGQ